VGGRFGVLTAGSRSCRGCSPPRSRVTTRPGPLRRVRRKVSTAPRSFTGPTRRDGRQARASGVSSGVTVAGKASAASFFGSKTTVGGAGRGAGAQPGASERPSRSTAATSSSSAGGRRGSARSAATSRVTEPAAILTVTGSGGACAAGGRSAWWRRAGRRSDSGGPGPLRVRRPRWPSHRWRPVR
jgi:hypothetical protein